SRERGETSESFPCYLSTTAGPIAGMLFISTEKIAFHSDRPLNLASHKVGSTRVPYKVIEAESPPQYSTCRLYLQVLISAKRVKGASVRGKLYNPDEKYIDLVTVDGFDFWLMGLISYEKSFRYLRHAISELR
ncbi:putative GEM-like protein 8, partial [Setaria viridis]|uniref:putative GEM-like protein 8 n=1 Tax=Setaria viridis TaxID=4556 RepID=UPI003B3B3EFA